MRPAQLAQDAPLVLEGGAQVVTPGQAVLVELHGIHAAHTSFVLLHPVEKDVFRIQALRDGELHTEEQRPRMGLQEDDRRIRLFREAGEVIGEKDLQIIMQVRGRFLLGEIGDPVRSCRRPPQRERGEDGKELGHALPCGGEGDG